MSASNCRCAAVCAAVTVALSHALASVASADTTLAGTGLAFRSSGTASGTAVTLSQNGYLGTYVRLAAPGAISFTANAAGTASNGVNPDLTFAIGDAQQSFSVTPGSANAYTFTSPTLAAGTYFVRAQLDNHKTVLVDGVATVANTGLTLNSLSVGANATVLNSGTDANALAAADTYINNYRKGTATVRLAGATPGSTVHVQLANNAFQLGTYVPGGYSSTDSYLQANPAANSDAANFQKFIAGRFNSIVPANAGKWDPDASVSSTGAQTTKIGQGIVDQMDAYAAAHGMAARQHNLIWGNQQPAQIKTWLTDAANASSTTQAASLAKLKTAISNRITTYINGTNSVNGTVRAANFQQLDVLNEALQTGNYYAVLGASGVADVYRQAQVAVAKAGANTKLYTNEYNVLQNAPITVTPSATYGAQAAATYGDAYANWYRNEVETINNAGLANGAPGDVVTGIGVQYYVTANGTRGPGTIQKAMQNLAVEGLPLSLTEFGGQTSIAAADAPQLVDDTIRMMMGKPGVDSMHIWGWYNNDGMNLDPYGDGTSLVNKGWYNADGSYNLTAAGVRFEYLFGRGLDPTAPGANADGSNPNPWTTDTTLAVNADGTIQFNGFYGDYDLTVGDQTYELTFDKGTNVYAITVPEPTSAAFVAAALAGALTRRRRPVRSGRQATDVA